MESVFGVQRQKDKSGTSQPVRTEIDKSLFCREFAAMLAETAGMNNGTPADGQGLLRPSCPPLRLSNMRPTALAPQTRASSTKTPHLFQLSLPGSHWATEHRMRINVHVGCRSVAAMQNNTQK